ncbi:succinate dehydrogenase [Dictyostelium discoideum AX4]|uniref:Succinate dehydrogenase [ubiquinone] cytochrome b small subunit n=1 Tax=Dictyostelium discoideum TaxID=44689 RepID=Q54YN1_DICDI|nr:succinate dehydrogenase [Dictyostelium discoideum AX4]EAL68251.1 succinate dehydrogenase [Dictyostelium discoideum AX4]|eukprot:XP_642171.1 succinate dehydrogenase [Dictyostelium discoideum AX4]
MIRAGKILQPSVLSPFVNGFLPKSALVSNKGLSLNSNKSLTFTFDSASIFSASSYSTTSQQQQQQKHLTARDKLPDNAKAILNYKVFHYSTIIVAVSILPTIFAQGTNLALVSDIALGISLPAHLYLGMEAVINDYIYRPALRTTSKILVGGAAIIVCAGLITLSLRDGIGSVVSALWK